MPVSTRCLDVSSQWVLTGQKATHILSYIKSSVTSRVRQGIIPFYSALVRPQPKCSIQVWRPQLMNITDLLEQVQGQAMKHLSC